MVAFVVKQFENLKSVTKIWVSQMDEIGFSWQRIPTHVYGWPTLPQFDHGYALLNTQRVALLSYALRNKSNV